MKISTKVNIYWKHHDATLTLDKTLPLFHFSTTKTISPGECAPRPLFYDCYKFSKNTPKVPRGYTCDLIQYQDKDCTAEVTPQRNPTRCLALFPSMEYFKWDCKKNTPDVSAVIYPKVSAVLYDSGACQTIESIYLFSKTIKNVPYNECTAYNFLSSDTTTIGDAPKDTVCYFETFSDSDCKTINDATELGGETSCKLQESRSYKYSCHAPYTFPTFNVGLYNNKNCQDPDSTIQDVVANQCHDLADSNQIARIKATQQGVVRAGQCVLKVFNANDCNGESTSNPPGQCTNAPAPELTDEAPVKSYFIFCKPYTG